MTVDFDLDVVRELHPPADEPVDARQRAREFARVALMAEIEQLPVPRPRRRSTSRSWLRPRRLAPLGLLGVVAAAAVAIVLGLPLRGGAANPTSAAAAVLQRAARAAAAAGGPRPLRPGEYWYVKSYETSTGALFVGGRSGPKASHVIVNALATIERQIWIGVDRPGMIVTRIAGPIKFLTAAARRRWIHDGRPRQAAALPSPMRLPADSFGRPYRELLRLPTNVDALYRQLEHDARNGSAAWKRHEIFTEIGDLLREDPVPAKVRAALYLVAARIPGIQMLGPTRDGIGRPALAVALNDSLNGLRDELLFDPHTSALVGESEVVVKPPPADRIKAGTVDYASTYISSTIVERLGQVPTR
jgi:hypothetical protein